MRLYNRAKLSASYFDAVEILEMKELPASSSDQTGGDLFHIKHGIYLYAPVGGTSDRQRIRNFWRKHKESLGPLYICMVRLTDESVPPEKLRSHIDWAFHDQVGIPRNKMLCYYSLDFCDLVLFVRDVQFSQHLTAVDILNFRVQEAGARIARDTISIYAVRPDALTDSVPLEMLASGKDRIHFTLRLGVLDFACLEDFYRAVQQALFPSGEDSDIHCEMFLGCSDFALYARGKDYSWIVTLWDP